MTVRLLARTSLLVGLVASLTSVGGFGCVDDKSKSDLDPEGPPRILQVFVLDGANSDDPLGSGYAITYGIHADVWACGVVDNNCAAGLSCATSGEFVGHCVDGDGRTPGATSAQAAGASFRIISKELLDGQTLEQFACACHGDEGDGCPAAAAWSIDPQNCSVCGDNPATTIDEAGRCLDVNNDRVPDLATLQAGVATITCPGVTGGAFGTNGVYVTGQGDGYYYPSGNQFPTSGFGYAGLGPAIVIEPLIELPAGASCTLSVSNTVTDKDGNSFDAPTEPISFAVEHGAAIGSDPAGAFEGDDPVEDVDFETDTIQVDFNVSVDPGSVSAATMGIREVGTTTFLPLHAVDADIPSPFEVDGPSVILHLAAELEPETEYEIVIPATVAQADYHIVLGTTATIITFTTAAAM